MSEIIIDLSSNLESKINIDKEMVLKEIFDNYYDRIYKFFIYRTNNTHLSEELTSTVFEKIVVNIDSYKDKESNLNAWIFTIARNTMYDYFRSDKSKYKRLIDDYEEILIAIDNVEDEVSRKEKDKKIFKMLNCLTERERAIIAYKFGAGLKNTEIGEVMNLSSSNIESILYRSLKKLRVLIEEEGQ